MTVVETVTELKKNCSAIDQFWLLTNPRSLEEGVSHAPVRESRFVLTGGVGFGAGKGGDPQHKAKGFSTPLWRDLTELSQQIVKMSGGISGSLEVHMLPLLS